MSSPAFVKDYNPTEEHASVLNCTGTVTSQDPRQYLPSGRKKSARILLSSFRERLVADLRSRAVSPSMLTHLFSSPLYGKSDSPNYLAVKVKVSLEEGVLTRELAHFKTLYKYARSFLCPLDVSSRLLQAKTYPVYTTSKPEGYDYLGKYSKEREERDVNYRINDMRMLGQTYRVLLLQEYRYSLYDARGKWIDPSDFIKSIIREAVRPARDTATDILPTLQKTYKKRAEDFASNLPLYQVIKDYPPGSINVPQIGYTSTWFGGVTHNASRRPHSGAGVHRYMKSSGKARPNPRFHQVEDPYQYCYCFEDRSDAVFCDCHQCTSLRNYGYYCPCVETYEEDYLVEPPVRAGATVRNSWNLRRYDNRSRQFSANWKIQRKVRRQYEREESRFRKDGHQHGTHVHQEPDGISKRRRNAILASYCAQGFRNYGKNMQDVFSDGVSLAPN